MSHPGALRPLAVGGTLRPLTTRLTSPAHLREKPSSIMEQNIDHPAPPNLNVASVVEATCWSWTAVRNIELGGAGAGGPPERYSTILDKCTIFSSIAAQVSDVCFEAGVHTRGTDRPHRPPRTRRKARTRQGHRHGRIGRGRVSGLDLGLILGAGCPTVAWSCAWTSCRAWLFASVAWQCGFCIGFLIFVGDFVFLFFRWGSSALCFLGGGQVCADRALRTPTVLVPLPVQPDTTSGNGGNAWPSGIHRAHQT